MSLDSARAILADLIALPTVSADSNLQLIAYARQMLDAMFALGRELGCEEAWVGTEPNNAAARSLYESRSGLEEPRGEPFVMYLYKL